MIRNMAQMSTICQSIKVTIKQQHINPQQIHRLVLPLVQPVQSVQAAIQSVQHHLNSIKQFHLIPPIQHNLLQIPVFSGTIVVINSKSKIPPFSHTTPSGYPDWSNWATGLDNLKSTMNTTSTSTISPYDPLSINGYQQMMTSMSNTASTGLNLNMQNPYSGTGLKKWFSSAIFGYNFSRIR